MQVGLDRLLEAIDLPAPPALQRSGIEPPDPDEDVRAETKFLAASAASAARATRSSSGTLFFRLIAVLLTPLLGAADTHPPNAATCSRS
jgi:hypothetical protein